MEIRLELPDNQSEIKLGDYQEFFKSIKANEEYEDENFIKMKAVQLFCNVPLLAVNKMKRNDFEQVSRHLFEVLQQEGKFIDRFKINGEEFGFVPNLDEISIGEYRDINKYIVDVKDHHKLMAVLYRPVKAKTKGGYLIEDYEGSDKYSETMKRSPLSVCKGALVFFWTLGKQLLSVTPRYIEQLLRTDKKAAAALEKSGAGISTFSNLLASTLSGLRMHLDSMSTLHTISLPSSKTTTTK